MGFFLDNRAELHGFLMKRLRNSEDSDDMLQEVYIRVKKYKCEEEIINVRSFVYRIANNLAIDKIRQRKRLMNHISNNEDNFSEIASGQPAADQVVYDRSRLQHLQKSLNNLHKMCTRLRCLVGVNP